MNELLHEINTTQPWFFPTLVTLLGACVGSFLNVCIHRLPRGESVIHPGSHCACGAPIAWYDNIPVLSWFLLRGRARCCGRPFSFRYPFVELLTAAGFWLCWQLFPAGQAVGGMVLVAIVLCATFIDLDHMIIPDAFTIGGAMLGLLLSGLLPALHGQQHDFYPVASLRAELAAVLGLFTGSGLVLWIALVAEAVLKKEAMGFGDVKFLGALGTFVGWKGAVFAMFGGAVLGCLWVALILVWQKATGRNPPFAPKLETPEGQPVEEVGLGVHVSFGPMLGLAALLYFFVAHRWFDAYVDSFRMLF